MLSEAKRAGVQSILLTDHYRPPKDFITGSWRGIREGVLFIPGSEVRGFLIYPTRSIMERMDDPTPGFIETVRRDGGLIFLSIPREERRALGERDRGDLQIHGPDPQPGLLEPLVLDGCRRVEVDQRDPSVVLDHPP
jgi:hypothetical protein